MMATSFFRGHFGNCREGLAFLFDVRPLFGEMKLLGTL